MTTFVHVALRLVKLGHEGDNDYDDEGGLKESQKTEKEYIEMRPEAPGCGLGGKE